MLCAVVITQMLVRWCKSHAVLCVCLSVSGCLCVLSIRLQPRDPATRAALEGQQPPCELSGGHTWPEVSVVGQRRALLAPVFSCTA